MPKSKLFANEGAKSLHAKETSAAWLATVVLEAVVFVLCCHAVAMVLPCDFDVVDMMLQCYCHDVALLLQCYGHDGAMLRPRYGHDVAELLSWYGHDVVMIWP